MKFRTVLVPLTMPIVLAACLGSGGGGGGGTSSGQSGPLTLGSDPTGSFTSFSDIKANSLVQLDSPDLVDDAGDPVAMSLNKAMELEDGNVPVNASGNLDGTVTTTTESSFIRLLTGDLDTDGEPEPEALRLSVGVPSGPAIVIDFTDFENQARVVDQAAPGDPEDIADYLAFEIADPNNPNPVTDRLVVHAPEDDADDLDYMSFGVWQLDLLETTGDFGGAAWGRVTEVANMPDPATTPSATYTGGLLGQHVIEGTGAITLYEAVSTVTANFNDTTVTLVSNDTRNLETGVLNENLDLRMREDRTATLSGNYFLSDDTDLVLRFTDGVTGQFGGAFYGDGAEEVGGWFDITNAGPSGSRYFGSFGGKAPN